MREAQAADGGRRRGSSLDPDSRWWLVVSGEEAWRVQECRRRQAPSEISSGSPDGISVGRRCARGSRPVAER